MEVGIGKNTCWTSTLHWKWGLAPRKNGDVCGSPKCHLKWLVNVSGAGLIPWNEQHACRESVPYSALDNGPVSWVPGVSESPKGKSSFLWVANQRSRDIHLPRVLLKNNWKVRSYVSVGDSSRELQEESYQKSAGMIPGPSSWLWLSPACGPLFWWM